MVFTAPAWVPNLDREPYDSIPTSEFMLNEEYGRQPFQHSLDPFTCGLSGTTYPCHEVRNRVTALAAGLSKELGFHPNKGNEWDKVICIYSLNTIDTLTTTWAIHYLSGISSPANAGYSEEELVYQLKSSKAKAIFTCLPLLQTSIGAAAKCGIPKKNIYLLPLPQEFTGGKAPPSGFKTVEQLIADGRNLPKVEALKWSKGQGARQTAFLCYSSGTSGLPKGVMISHRNVIANVLQICAFEKPYRDVKKRRGSRYPVPEVALGLLPQSHIYSLVVICHAASYRGDQIINLPKFEMGQLLSAVQRFKMNTLFLVPPIIIGLANNPQICAKFDLSSVTQLFTGAAPLGAETAESILKQYPKWQVRQGYGLTETSTVMCSTAYDDIWLGSCGSLLPHVQARIVSTDGREITEYGTPGELVVKSPSVVLGYLNNDKANKETFVHGWMHTGDEAVIRKAPSGNEHVFIVDRIKELIKVKAHQVAPAELEAHILTHESVADCCVIPIYDPSAGERPKAFVVKKSSVGLEANDQVLVRGIKKHVEDHKSRYKWLAEVEFIDGIPKSPSGKILRRLLRDKDRQARKQAGPKL